MAYKATVIQVMIASPKDVSKEREIVSEVLHQWNNAHSKEKSLILLPTSWETHSVPTMGERAQASINRQVLEPCELLIGIFWTRLGTLTGIDPSGTAEEIRRHVEAGKPAMVYFSSASVQMETIDVEQWNNLKNFKAQTWLIGRTADYVSLENFRSTLSHHIALIINNDNYLKSIYEKSVEEDLNVGKDAGFAFISADALHLLRETGKHGKVWKNDHRGCYYITFSGTQIVDQNDPRSIAHWKAAFEELELYNLVEAFDHYDFRLTNTGYKVLDQNAEPRKLD